MEEKRAAVVAVKPRVAGRKWEAMQDCQAAVRSYSKATESHRPLTMAQMRGLGWLRG